MKRIFAIIVVLCFSGGLFAQLQFEKDTLTANGPLDGGKFVFYTKVANSGKIAITPKWERVVNDLPGDWESQICIGGLCYNSTANKGTSVEAIPGGGADTTVSVHITNDGSNSGQGIVQLRVWDPQDSAASAVTGYFEYATFPTGLEGRDDLDEELRIYPNPATTSIRLSNTGNLAKGHHLEIMNMTGEVNVEYPIDQGSVLIYDISMLHPGVYLLSVRDSEDQIVLTRKLVVK